MKKHGRCFVSSSFGWLLNLNSGSCLHETLFSASLCFIDFHGRSAKPKFEFSWKILKAYIFLKPSDKFNPKTHETLGLTSMCFLNDFQGRSAKLKFEFSRKVSYARTILKQSDKSLTLTHRNLTKCYREYSHIPCDHVIGLLYTTCFILCLKIHWNCRPYILCVCLWMKPWMNGS